MSYPHVNVKVRRDRENSEGEHQRLLVGGVVMLGALSLLAVIHAALAALWLTGCLLGLALHSRLSRRHERVVLALTAVSIVAVAVLAGAVTASEEAVTDIDSDTPLTESETVENYSSNEAVTVKLDEVNASISVVEDADDIKDFDASAFEDAGTEYLVLDYNEDLERTIRIHVPNEYWMPYGKSNVEPVEGNANVSFEVVEAGNATSVTWELARSERVIVETDWIRKRVFKKGMDINSLVSTVTGYSAANDSQWTYLDSVELAGENSSVSIDKPPSDVTVQYLENSYWYVVPPRDSGEEVFYYQNGGQTIVVSVNETPPSVRYVPEDARTRNFKSYWNELRRGVAKYDEVIPGGIPFVGVMA